MFPACEKPGVLQAYLNLHLLTHYRLPLLIFGDGASAKQVDSTLRGFDTLKTQHRNVSAKTRALHESCERLVEEKERLVEFAEALRSKLAYFDELERIASQFHSGVMAVDSDHFLPILHRLDECITCAQGHLLGLLHSGRSLNSVASGRLWLPLYVHHCKSRFQLGWLGALEMSASHPLLRPLGVSNYLER